MHSILNISVFSYVLIGQISKYQKKAGESFPVVVIMLKSKSKIENCYYLSLYFLQLIETYHI